MSLCRAATLRGKPDEEREISNCVTFQKTGDEKSYEHRLPASRRERKRKKSGNVNEDSGLWRCLEGFFNLWFEQKLMEKETGTHQNK